MMTGSGSEDSDSQGPSTRILDKGKGRAIPEQSDDSDPDLPIPTIESTDTTTPAGIDWGDHDRVMAERDAVFNEWDQLLPALRTEVRESGSFLDKAEARYERTTGKRVADFDYEKERAAMNKKLNASTKFTTPFMSAPSASTQLRRRRVDPISSPRTRYREGMSAFEPLNRGQDKVRGGDTLEAHRDDTILMESDEAVGGGDKDVGAGDEPTGAGTSAGAGASTGVNASAEGEEYQTGVHDVRAWNEISSEFVPLDDFVPQGEAHTAIMNVVSRMNTPEKTGKRRLPAFLRAHKDVSPAQDEPQYLTCRCINLQTQNCADSGFPAGSKYACYVCVVEKANHPCCKLYREPTGKWYVGFHPLPLAIRESDAPDKRGYWVATKVKASKSAKAGSKAAKTTAGGAGEKAEPAVTTRSSRRKKA